MNPYQIVLDRLGPDDYGTDRMLREYLIAMVPVYDTNPRPFQASNPFAAILELGMPDVLSIHRRMRQRIEELAT